ncbi:unnamed protein product [Vitrella brassicaformis CCMP3155]|uniref:Uncharacterized protein n=2 Tax=Vitrella brassicaformis TaxID=1169539 RepID=A0A0G4ELR6_VITBC|nr:unnamed protein product [Vitrella brassicaformis CCMP3155]|mmetsp:Transcript_8294/g.20260  ORF Transcript_8294/g.20260 Transcript_8294/m.20260 type:complete len:218 (+) Transcript_8294:194-847(+)|eukprot:CEL97773.1 unnamed protein product [Vitrella brassicaformis CCMP3155]
MVDLATRGTVDPSAVKDQGRYWIHTNGEAGISGFPLFQETPCPRPNYRIALPPPPPAVSAAVPSVVLTVDESDTTEAQKEPRGWRRFFCAKRTEKNKRQRGFLWAGIHRLLVAATELWIFHLLRRYHGPNLAQTLPDWAVGAIAQINDLVVVIFVALFGMSYFTIRAMMEDGVSVEPYCSQLDVVYGVANGVVLWLHWELLVSATLLVVAMVVALML